MEMGVGHLLTVPAEQNCVANGGTVGCYDSQTFGDTDDQVLFALHLLRTSCTMQGKASTGGLAAIPPQ